MASRFNAAVCFVISLVFDGVIEVSCDSSGADGVVSVAISGMVLGVRRFLILW